MPFSGGRSLTSPFNGYPRKNKIKNNRYDLIEPLHNLAGNIVNETHTVTRSNMKD